MEPIEESTALSPKESIVNILGRLFNNGHISGDELAMMQMELVARNPEPPASTWLKDDLVTRLTEELVLAERLRRADEEAATRSKMNLWSSAGMSPLHGSNPFKIPASGTIGIGTSDTRPDTTMFPPISMKYPLGTEYGSAPGLYGYIDANKLTDIFKDAEDI